MRNLLYRMTRHTINDIEKSDDGFSYFLLAGLFILSLVFDTLFLPFSIILSFLVKGESQ